ncbi:hypothetical protein TRFO_41753 [Tritrichomonas foetus]|uniref:F5/8 type C domain-containing protein n=1 Tax=Tritrichomonas foetus TaxID=1144522 RepID=A0A1J4L3G4_9EUKA|nr:hypothetical protein TRFO_41753 [Tritrichomonas foetus]|eukprot:OHT16516.1 hypothetical protein TRFO_41753 [Tritrichomonas foetus]
MKTKQGMPKKVMNLFNTMKIQHYESINKNILPEDFTFIIDDRKYLTNKFLADILSPKIANLHRVDASLSTFTFPKSISDPSGNFSFFINLIYSGNSTFDYRQIDFYLQIARILENVDLVKNFLKYKITKHEISLSAIINDLLLLDSFEIRGEDLNLNKFYGKVIAFAAENFIHLMELSHNSNKKSKKIRFNKKNNDLFSILSLNTLEMILSHENLVIESEIKLFSFIQSLVETRGPEFEVLYQYIEFVNLTRDEMSCLCNEYNLYGNMNPFIWDKIVERLISGQLSSFDIHTFKRYNKGSQNQLFLPNLNDHRDFCGFITYLNNITQSQNCSENGTISVTSSSTQVIVGDIEQRDTFVCNLHNLSSRSMWSPNGKPNSYIQFDFRDRVVNLTHYVFCTPTDETQDYPRSWSVYGSNDKQTWELLDKRVDESRTNSCDVVVLFDCNEKNDTFFRYIRIQSDSPCWNHSPRTRYYFDLSGVEFYGTMLNT